MINDFFVSDKMAKKRYMAEVQRAGFNIDKEWRNKTQFLRAERNGSCT